MERGVRGMYEIVIDAWNGMDAVMRISNMARRAKLRYRSLAAEFNGDGRLRIRITAEGDGFEVKWLAAKLDRMPEIYRVEARLLEAKEPAVAAAVARG